MKIQAIPCHLDNYAWLLHNPETGEAAVVDPSESLPVEQALAACGGRLTHILCTHHHADHVDGIADLKRLFPQAEVCCHSSDLSRIAGAERGVEKGDELEICGERLSVLHTPGHTRGSICWLSAEALFSGDTLFSAGCGRLFEGDAEQMSASLAQLTPLAESIRLCFGHEYTEKNLQFAASIEPDNTAVAERLRAVQIRRGQGGITAPSTLGVERLTNPFLRCADPSLVEAVRQRLETDATTPVAVFAALRRARNNY